MENLTELIKKNEYLYASAIADIFSVSKPGSESDVNEAVKKWKDENSLLFYSLFYSEEDLKKIDDLNFQCCDDKYVIQKFGGLGATSFMVTIDECHDELSNLFLNGCGFRQCASETLWKIEKPIPQKTDLIWRYAQNNDSKHIAELYNSELLNIYKPSLTRHEKEFQDAFFSGFNDYYKTRCVLEEEKKLLGYFSITTSDNLNYIFDMTLNSGYQIDYEKVINTMLCEIARKRKAFYPLIKQKKYLKDSERLGNYLESKGYNRIQTKQILVKDFYKPIKQESANWNVFLLGEDQGINVVTNHYKP